MSSNAEVRGTVLKKMDDDDQPEVRETVLKKTDDDDQPREYMVIRRKKARHRPPLVAEAPQQKFRFVLLSIVVLLIIVVLSGSQIRQIVRETLQHTNKLLPFSLVHTLARPEVLVLLLAALILIYLMVPGLEPKLMSLLGINRSRRRR